MQSQRVDELAKKIWDYHHMGQALKRTDAIFALGSSDLRVAERAVQLYKAGYAPAIIFSGRSGRITQDTLAKSEVEAFADVARASGVPDEHIYLEDRSTNTGENIVFTKQLIEEVGLNIRSMILVHKPYMERRTYATFMKQWPEMKFLVTSPQMSYEEYPTTDLPKELVISIMVGDLQRIREYPKQGFQIPQEMPDDVWAAYEELVALGYDKHLMRS